LPGRPLIQDCRFPRSVRLLATADFQRVFAHPERSADSYFTVLAATRSGAARLGLAISRKQVRRAVDRNRLKRLVREAFRKAKAGLTGVDLVIMARSAAVTADNAKLTASLDRHFDRITSRIRKS